MKVAQLCNLHWNTENVYKEEYEKFPTTIKYKCVICCRAYNKNAYDKLTPEQKRIREKHKREKKKLKKLKLMQEKNHQLEMQNPASYLEMVLDKKVKLIKKIKPKKRKKKNNSEYSKKYNKNSRENLHDGYVKSTFAADSITLTGKDVPESVIDAYRELIKLKRYLKKQKES
jgi:hypothetical protein